MQDHAHGADSGDAKQAPQPKRKRASKAVVLAKPAAPQGLPALFERAASAANFDIEALSKLLALKREIEADAERRAFDQDFAALQAEIGRVASNAYDPQKRSAYADRNALDDAVRPLLVAKGMSLTFSSAPSPDSQSLTVVATVSRNGVERQTAVVVRMDGVGLKGNSNMSPAQASGATFTYGCRMAQTALFNLTIDKQRQPQARPAPDLFDRSDPLPRLRRAARHAHEPPSDDEIIKLALFLRERSEAAEAVIVNGALERSAVKRFVIERKEARS